MSLCQGFTRVLDMTQILFREICFRRKEVLLYSEGFAQITIGLFSLCNFVNPCIRWEDIGLKSSPSSLSVSPPSSVFSLSEEPVFCVCSRDWSFLMVSE